MKTVPERLNVFLRIGWSQCISSVLTKCTFKRTSRQSIEVEYVASFEKGLLHAHLHPLQSLIVQERNQSEWQSYAANHGISH